MPVTTALKEFAEAVVTKMTKTTKALDEVYADRGAFPAADVAALGDHPAGLDTLPPWLKDALKAKGLNKMEINHINKWPSEQRKQVSAKVAEAAAANHPLHFFWDMHEGDTEAIKIEPDPTAGQGAIKITFLSPWNRVKVWGLGYILEKITVDVG